MRISEIHVWKEDLKLSRPYTIAYRRIDHVENIFLLIRLDNGACGLGGAAPAEAVTGESLADSQDALQEMADRIRGRDIRTFHTLLREARHARPDRPAALAALDGALHDAFCQFIQLPLAVFLGQVHRSLPTSVTLGIGPVEDTLREARAFLEQGFTALKLKTGLDVEADLDTCRQLRDRLGRHFTLRVDANQGYSPEQLKRFWGQSRELDIELIEQPLPRGQQAPMQQLPGELRKDCAADESLHDRADAYRLSQRPHAFGIFNIKLMKCGGIQPALDIAAFAQAARIGLMWGCNDESRVSIAAALHAALACPATRYLDLDGSFDLLHDIAEGGFVLREGRLSIPPQPGLGLRILPTYDALP